MHRVRVCMNCGSHNGSHNPIFIFEWFKNASKVSLKNHGDFKCVYALNNFVDVQLFIRRTKRSGTMRHDKLAFPVLSRLEFIDVSNNVKSKFYRAQNNQSRYRFIISSIKYSASAWKNHDSFGKC